MMISLDGGTPTTLATGESYPVHVAVDGANVYWAAAGTASAPVGAVKRLPRGGGSPTTIAVGFAWGVALDETSVYWTGQSTVERLTPK